MNGRRIAGIALCVLGVAVAIFAVVWVTVLWPSLSKIPADFDQETIQEGTVTLYNAEHHAYDNYSVTNSRHYVAVQASRDIVYLDETLTFTNLDTDEDMPSLQANYLLAVNRSTRVNVEGRGDGVGGGYYAFPFNVDKNRVYPFWTEGNPENLDCRWTGVEQEFSGLHVYVFQMTTPEEGLVVPASFDAPHMRIDQTITRYVEPVSGVTLYFESSTKRSGTIPVLDPLFPATNPATQQAVTFYQDHLRFTDATVADLASQARSAKTWIGFAKNVLPWVSIGVGIIIVAFGIFLATRKERGGTGEVRA